MKQNDESELSAHPVDEAAPDPLQDWHRYVDSVSRPARRLRGSAEASWRPWKDTPPEEEVGESLRPDQLPDLSEILAAPGARRVLSETRHRATLDFEDPTLHDELQPIPSYTAPRLSAPSFDLTIPRLQPRRPAPTARVEPALAEPVEAAGEADRVSKAAQYRQLLEQLRGDGTSDRARMKESRDELVSRLMDPTLTLEQTAVFLNVCPATVRRYTNKGLLNHFRTQGNQRRFRLSDVLEFLDSRTAEVEADSQADQQAGES